MKSLPRRLAALIAIAALPLLAACGHTHYTTHHVVVHHVVVHHVVVHHVTVHHVVVHHR